MSRIIQVSESKKAWHVRVRAGLSVLCLTQRLHPLVLSVFFF